MLVFVSDVPLYCDDPNRETEESCGDEKCNHTQKQQCADCLELLCLGPVTWSNRYHLWLCEECHEERAAEDWELDYMALAKEGWNVIGGGVA